MKRNIAQGSLNEICQIYPIYFLRKMVHVVIDGYVSLFLKGFEDFSSPEAITNSPFKATYIQILMSSRYTVIVIQ